MSKVKLLLDVISDMRSLADSLEAVANAMCDSQPVPKPAEAEAPEPEIPAEVENEKDEAPTLDYLQMRTRLGEISRDGHGEELRAILAKYGETHLSKIDPKHYPAILAEAEVL